MMELCDFINQPPSYEEKRTVRDYRHELARKFIPVVDEISRLNARITELTRDMEHFEQCIDDNARLNAKISELEKDARRYQWLRKRMLLQNVPSVSGARQDAFFMRFGHHFVNGGSDDPGRGYLDRSKYEAECNEIDQAIDSNVPGNK